MRSLEDRIKELCFIVIILYINRRPIVLVIVSLYLTASPYTNRSDVEDPI